MQVLSWAFQEPNSTLRIVGLHIKDDLQFEMDIYGILMDNEKLNVTAFLIEWRSWVLPLCGWLDVWRGKPMAYLSPFKPFYAWISVYPDDLQESFLWMELGE